MIKTIVRCKNPEILVITPLRKGDKVSKSTKKSLKRNKVPFTWISYMGDNNPVKNVDIAYKQYRKDNQGLPPYVIKIDNDLTTNRYMLDKMIEELDKSTKNISYAYCPFQFTGHLKVQFPSVKFDSERLMKHNYISSCSLISTSSLDNIGGWITNDKYKGLLDWCLWLEFLKKGYQGVLVPNTTFSADSSPTSVSSWPVDSYEKTRKLVLSDFVRPIRDNIS